MAWGPLGTVGQRRGRIQDRAQALLEIAQQLIYSYRRQCQCTGVIAPQNKESFPSYEAYTQYLQSLRDSTSMSITLLLTESTNSQQVNTLAEEFLDCNEDEANPISGGCRY